MSLSEGLENKDALKDPSKVILNDDQKISQNNQEPRKEVCKVQAIPQIGQQTSASFTDFKSDDCLSYGTTVNSTFSILEFNQREYSMNLQNKLRTHKDYKSLLNILG